MDNLKTVYQAPDCDLALAAFASVKDKWGRKYPKEMKSWEDQLPMLLTFYKYPAMIKQAIYTSNPIERTIKEFRKRLRPMNSVPSIEAAEKIVFLEITDYNERWSQRAISGFADPACKQRLLDMFKERYEPEQTKDTPQEITPLNRSLSSQQNQESRWSHWETLSAYTNFLTLPKAGMD